MRDTDIVIWYRPRVRLWLDDNGDWHLAGEPDGISKVVAAFREVARGVSDSAEAELRTDPIPIDRNPVPSLGVSKRYGRVIFERIPKSKVAAGTGLVIGDHRR